MSPRAEVAGISKRRGDDLALDDARGMLRSGLVTGLPAPDGAGPAGARTGAPLWDVTFLHRPGPGRATRIAGGMRIDALTAGQARKAALDGLMRLAGDGSNWSLGLLRPLAPGLPGTHLYGVTFSAWIEEAAQYRREDVCTIQTWATDGDSARRMARLKAETLPAYRGAWRIRRVERLAGSSPARANGARAA